MIETGDAHDEHLIDSVLPHEGQGQGPVNAAGFCGALVSRVGSAEEIRGDYEKCPPRLADLIRETKVTPIPCLVRPEVWGLIAWKSCPRKLNSLRKERTLCVEGTTVAYMSTIATEGRNP